MNGVITIESEAFWKLVEETVSRINRTGAGSIEDRWVNTEEAKRILGVTSPTTLWKLRTEGAVRYSHPSHKIILYDKYSLVEYLNKHAKETF